MATFDRHVKIGIQLQALGHHLSNLHEAEQVFCTERFGVKYKTLALIALSLLLSFVR